jgi:hypothetical protein
VRTRSAVRPAPTQVFFPMKVHLIEVPNYSSQVHWKAR